MPDVDGGALQGCAGRGVDDGEAEPKWGARPALGEVAANVLTREVVRPFGHLGGEHAFDRPRGDSGGAGSLTFGGDGLKAAGAEQGCEDAADLGQGAAAADALFCIHPASVTGAPGKRL